MYLYIFCLNFCHCRCLPSSCGPSLLCVSVFWFSRDTHLITWIQSRHLLRFKEPCSLLLSSPDSFVTHSGSTLGRSLLPSVSYLVLCCRLLLWVIVVPFCSRILIASPTNSAHLLDSRHTSLLSSSFLVHLFTLLSTSACVSPPENPPVHQQTLHTPDCILTQLSEVLITNLFKSSNCLCVRFWVQIKSGIKR